MTVDSLKTEYARLAGSVAKIGKASDLESSSKLNLPYMELQGARVLKMDEYDKLGRLGRATHKAHIPMSRAKYVALYKTALNEPLLQDPDLLLQITKIIQHIDKQLEIINETKAMIEAQGPEFLKQTHPNMMESERDYSDEEKSFF